MVERDVGVVDGVLSKINEQTRAWRKAGHEVKLFALSCSNTVWRGITDVPVEIVFSPRMRYSVFRAARLVTLVQGWRPDIVYLRSMVYYPPIERLLSSKPVVIEMNTKELSEAKNFSPFLALYRRFTRGRILRQARGLVAVTHEIAEDVVPFGRPTVVIANGIDLESRPSLPPAKNATPRLVFLGAFNSPWHGVDKIVWLAHHFRTWHFDLVGGIRVNDLPPNVQSHGTLEPSECVELMASADVAFGTLALHRKAMEEACPLKLRDYLACGIPAIIGYRDTDFPHPASFLLQLPNRPDNVQSGVAQIERFVARWQGQRVLRRDIAHIDNLVKEKQRLLFFEKILHEMTNQAARRRCTCG